jgi:hypothetical protein
MSTPEEPETDVPVEPPQKTYLGDSVYVEFNGYYITLMTMNGYPDDPRHSIDLEPEVLEKLERFVKQVRAYREDYQKRHP